MRKVGISTFCDSHLHLHLHSRQIDDVELHILISVNRLGYIDMMAMVNSKKFNERCDHYLAV